MSENIFKSAVVHHSKKNFSKAKKIYEDLLLTDPHNFNVLQNYAALLSQIKEYEKSDDTFKKCLKIKPKDPLLLYNYGKFFHDQKIFEKAIRFYTESFKLNPKNGFPLYNVGNIYSSQGKFEQAIDSFKKVIEINPSNFVAHNNIGIAYKRIGDFNNALKFYKQAIVKKNDYVDAHLNYSTMLLTMNKLEEGLEEYEWRKKSKSFSDYADYRSLNLKSKVWNGENLKNKKLFIIAEQGIGDLIQFARYLYLLKDKYKAKIILKIKGKNFLHFFDQKDFKIILDNQTIPIHDYHNFMMSLPRIFFKTNELFCKQVNFFQSDSKAKEKWKKKLENIDGVKVGVHWSTSSLMPERDLPFDHFNKLSKDVNAKFFVLQKNVSLDESKSISKNENFFHFSDMDESEKAFIDSIEIIRNLDLVITSDTAIGHLSATLGKKTWIALPMVADWRWFMDKKKTKWYPNVTLYRQEKIGEWERVFEIIRENFKKEFKNKVSN